MTPADPGRRLIAFCAGIVVPADLLSDLSGPAYNFHPGSPEFPGSCSASFAIYAGAARFAATAHEMRAAVDSGPIVATSWFDVPPASKYVDLELMTVLSIGAASGDRRHAAAAQRRDLVRSDPHQGRGGSLARYRG